MRGWGRIEGVVNACLEEVQVGVCWGDYEGGTSVSSLSVMVVLTLGLRD